MERHTNLAKHLLLSLVITIAACSLDSGGEPSQATISPTPGDGSPPSETTATPDDGSPPPEFSPTLAQDSPTPNDISPTPAYDPYEGRTVGLLGLEPEAFDGYTLFAPLYTTDTYLIDLEGNLLHRWPGDFHPGYSVYLLENGLLLRTGALGDNETFGVGGGGGIVRLLDWDGNPEWEYRLSNDSALLHHDVQALPNGNVLMVAWEYKTLEEVVAAGRAPENVTEGSLWPDFVLEVAPEPPDGGSIVWEWHVWDHLVQDVDPEKPNYGVIVENPGQINLNYMIEAGADWNHINAIHYNEALDQILLSAHGFNEIWIIDHSTTTEEAAGRTGGRYGIGGDLLYRWGNPNAYFHGPPSERQLFGQHDVQWIAEGLPGANNILLFNNGLARMDGSEYSTVDELEPGVGELGAYPMGEGGTFQPEEPTWRYIAPNPEDFYAHIISGAERMPNGNTLICDGTEGLLFEVTQEGNIVWKYRSPVVPDGMVQQGEAVPLDDHGLGLNSLFRARRLSPDYPGLMGNALSPEGPLETYPDEP